MIKTSILGAGLLFASLGANAISAGDIAFTGFNADSSSFSFVALTDLSATDVILFSNADQQGGSFIGSHLATYSWTAGTSISAGTVIEIDNFGKSYEAVSAGTLSRLPGGTFTSINSSEDTIYAFTGSTSSPTFIAAISNAKLSANVFSGTGLTGSEAIELSTGSTGKTFSADYAQFSTALRSTPKTAAEWETALADRTNWTIGSNDGNYNNTALSKTVFAISAVPEPSSTALLLSGLLMVGAVARKRLQNT